MVILYVTSLACLHRCYSSCLIYFVVQATVLIETLPAAFEMDEILFELREHSAGLNCGRWDYIFSFIKTLREDPKSVMPDRYETFKLYLPEAVTMSNWEKFLMYAQTQLVCFWLCTTVMNMQGCMLNLARVSNTHHHLHPFDDSNVVVIFVVSIGNCTVLSHGVCGSSTNKACMAIQSHLHCSLTRNSVICLQCQQFSACCHLSYAVFQHVTEFWP